MLTISRTGTDIFRTDEHSGFFFQNNGSTYTADRIVSSIVTDTELVVTASTSPDNVPVTLTLTFSGTNIRVRFEAVGELPNEKTGFNVELAAAGHWYGGNVTSAHIWPLETGSIVLEPFYATSNQAAPVWLTSSGGGLLMNTHREMGFSINENDSGLFSLYMLDTSVAEVEIIIGENIVEAYYSMIDFIGLPGMIPPKDFFYKPIFNTWIEFFTDVNQQSVTDYAKTIQRMDIPYAILMIDDGWAAAYGDFSFDKNKFPDPASMMSELDAMGFKVALWLTPFIEKASENFRYAAQQGYLLLDESGMHSYITTWWNGDAALIDFSNPEAYDWFVANLKGLVEQYGLAGFKLDGGDAEYLSKPYTSYGSISPNMYTDLFASVGSHFEINEFRVSWLTQPLGLIQRLRDKGPNWSKEDGLNSLIPHGLAVGLIGYPYFCPDMIGGGLDGGFRNEEFRGMDPELFIRWTQASTLMPMMQFSYAPWHLDEESLEIVKRYIALHHDLGDYIYDCVQEAHRTGTPIIRPLFFRNPDDPITYTIQDQFMLGDRYLVAPVLEKGAVSRNLYLPKGTWIDFWSRTEYRGPQMLNDFPAPLDLLPVFISTE